MKHSSKISIIFASVFVLFFVFALFVGSHIWLLNYVVSFICTVTIMIGTYLGYKRGLSKEEDSSGVVYYSDDDRESIEGDKYDLLGDDEDEKKVEEQDLKELKKEVSRFSFSNMILGSKIFFSFYRIFGYALFIGATIYLIDNEMWSVGGYVAGIFATTISLILSIYFTRED